MAGIPRNLSVYLNNLFTELHKILGQKVFSCSSGRVSGCYSRIVHFTADQKEYLFSLCCCQDSEAKPECLFLGAYMIDALEEEIRRTLSERGGDFLAHSDAPLYGGVSPGRAVISLRKNAEELLADVLYHSHGIQFNMIDCLSLMEYEQERAKGDLVFLPVETEDTGPPCVWSVPIQSQVECSTENLRTLRKLLAGATPDNSEDISSALLFIKKEELPVFFGTVRLEMGLPLFDPRLGYVQVQISGPLRWKLLMYGKFVFSRDSTGLGFPDGLDYTETEKTINDQIQDALRTAFTQEDSSKAVAKNLERLTNIVQSVKKQHHGAALVVADWERRPKCRQILDRLKQHKKALPVTFAETGSQSIAITCAAKMDGAVLADIQSGQIVALATILDGKSCVKGEPSRGARYNSIANATRLLRASKAHPEVVSFVFSSDGGMDILF